MSRADKRKLCSLCKRKNCIRMKKVKGTRWSDKKGIVKP